MRPMIRKPLTDDNILQLKEAIDSLRNVRDILTNLAGPYLFTKDEQIFMWDVLALESMLDELIDSYEYSINHPSRIDCQMS